MLLIGIVSAVMLYQSPTATAQQADGIQPRNEQECRAWGGRPKMKKAGLATPEKYIGCEHFKVPDEIREDRKASIDSSRNAKECRNNGGYIDPAIGNGDWDPKYCLTENQYTASQHKNEFVNNKDEVCKLIGIDDCEERLSKAYDHCINKLGVKSGNDFKNKIERDQLVSCVSTESKIDKNTLDNSLKGKRTVNEGERPVCVVSGLGWVICPVMRFLGWVADGLYGAVGHFLHYDTLTQEKSNKSVRQVWAVFRNLANIGFIITFLAIIFSHVSNVGISNYNIKQMLPRLIVLSMLVNLSFPLASVAVDISNIAGSSLKDLLERSVVRDGFEVIGFRDTASAILAGTATSVFLGVIAVGVGGLVVKGAFYGLIGIFLPALITAVIATGVSLIILIARQSFITILITITPVALLLQLLPNTRKFYTKWRQAFLSLLLLYPIISLIFGTSKLTAYIIYNSHRDDILIQITAVSIQAVPLIIIPLLLKTMGGTFGLGRILSRQTKALNNHLTHSANKAIDFRKKQAGIKSMGMISKKFTPKKEDSRLKRRGKRFMAAIAGGSAYRAHNRAMDSSYKELSFNRSADKLAAHELSVNPSASGFRSGTLHHDFATSQTFATASRGEREEVKAQQVLLRSRSAGELRDIARQPNLDNVQKVALLQEFANRDDIFFIEYAQILVSENGFKQPYSALIGSSVATILQEHAPGLVPQNTLERIATAPARNMPYYMPESPLSTETHDVTLSPIYINSIAEKATKKQQSDKKDHDEEPSKAAAALDELLEQKPNLRAEMIRAILQDDVSMKDITKISPEVLEYALKNGTDLSKKKLTQVVQAALADDSIRQELKNLDKLDRFDKVSMYEDIFSEENLSKMNQRLKQEIVENEHLTRMQKDTDNQDLYTHLFEEVNTKSTKQEAAMQKAMEAKQKRAENLQKLQNKHASQGFRKGVERG